MNPAVEFVRRRMKVDSFFLVIILLVGNKSADGEFMCDKYFLADANGNHTFFTIAEYILPRNRYTRKLNESIVCPCSPTRPCLRKCCLEDDVFVLSNKQCRRQDDSNSAEDLKLELENIPNNPIIGDHTLIHGSHCASVGKSTEKLKILKDGSIQLNDHFLSWDKYCIEYFDDKKDLGLLECVEQTPPENTKVPKIFTICLGLSIFCLIITFVVYLCVEKLRNLPGKVLLCYVSSLISTETCLILLQIFPETSGLICVAAACVFQFSFSATFFWLNVMCFDLWLTFRGHRFPKQSTRADPNSKKFTIYCLYAWGVPLTISIITLLCELSIIPGDFVKPDIGKDICWFKTYEATFWYFYSYTSVLLLLNLYMFVTTLSNLFKKEKIRKIFKKDGNKRHNEQEKQRFFLYLKLFLIMGINWIMDVLSYYMNGFEYMQHIWFITDLMSTLQGFLILSIFVCNRKVLVLLNKKIYPSKSLISEKKNFVRNSSRSTTTIHIHRGNTQISVDMKVDSCLQSQGTTSRPVQIERDVPEKSQEILD